MKKAIPILIGVFLLFSPAKAPAYYQIESETTETVIKDNSEEEPTPDPPCLPKINPYCSCIVTARMIGLDLPKYVHAGDIRPNTSIPEIGGGILLSYSVEHIAVIKGMDSVGMFVAEGNFERGKYTERYISFKDPSIRGYYVLRNDPNVLK